MTLRDELAAVLGPGNDDAIAYAQADAVLAVLADHGAVVTKDEAEVLGVLVAWHMRATGALVLQGRGGEQVNLVGLAEHLFDAAPDRGTLPAVPAADWRPWRPAAEEARFHVAPPPQVRPGEILERLRELAVDLPRSHAERQARDEALVAWLRSSLLGFTGRLDGGRLHITPDEAAILRERIVTVARQVPAGLDLGALDVVVDEEPRS